MTGENFDINNQVYDRRFIYAKKLQSGCLVLSAISTLAFSALTSYYLGEFSIDPSNPMMTPQVQLDKWFGENIQLG